MEKLLTSLCFTDFQFKILQRLMKKLDLDQFDSSEKWIIGLLREHHPVYTKIYLPGSKDRPQDDLPFEVQVKHIIKDYHRISKNTDAITKYAKWLEEELKSCRIKLAEFQDKFRIPAAINEEKVNDLQKRLNTLKEQVTTLMKKASEYNALEKEYKALKKEYQNYAKHHGHEDEIRQQLNNIRAKADYYKSLLIENNIEVK